MHFVLGQFNYMVDIVYAPLNAPIIHLHLDVRDNATVLEVLQQSGLLESHPEIQQLSVGIFSKLVDYSTKISVGDRIEIYRPLLIDPMEKRRQRAKKIVTPQRHPGHSEGSQNG